ncbi:MAG: DUF6106 family protein [Turicibacter sp.]|nr:DUF6106 family protein [Turicibacter sp.]
MDVFNEQMVKKRPTTRDTLLKIGIVLLSTVLALVFVLSIPTIGLLIACAIIFGGYVLVGRLNKEYEYALTNGELDIDIIYNRSSRKRVFTGLIKDFEMMSPLNSPENQSVFSTASERHDYSSGVAADKAYIFLAHHKGKKIAVIIEPNEELLEAISKFMPRSKFKK